MLLIICAIWKLFSHFENEYNYYYRLNSAAVFYLQVVSPNTSPCVFLGFCAIAFLVKSSPSFPLGIIVIFPQYETTCCSHATQQGKKSFHCAFGVDCIKLQQARSYPWRESVRKTISEVRLYRHRAQITRLLNDIAYAMPRATTIQLRWQVVTTHVVDPWETKRLVFPPTSQSKFFIVMWDRKYWYFPNKPLSIFPTQLLMVPKFFLCELVPCPI